MSVAVKLSWSSYTGIIVWFKNMDLKCCFPFWAMKTVSMAEAWSHKGLRVIWNRRLRGPLPYTHIITCTQARDIGHIMLRLCDTVTDSSKPHLCVWNVCSEAALKPFLLYPELYLPHLCHKQCMWKQSCAKNSRNWFAFQRVERSQH